MSYDINRNNRCQKSKKILASNANHNQCSNYVIQFALLILINIMITHQINNNILSCKLEQ